MSSPWKKRRKIPDPQVRDAADQFDDARLLLDSQPPGSGLLLPLINNAAVALELYLKSLGALAVYTPVSSSSGVSIVTAEAEVKGHCLFDLLESIPDDVRQSLEWAYKARHTGRVLRDDLEQYEGLFAASRYVFEKGKKLDKYPLSPLMDLCSFLRDFVSKMKSVRVDEQGESRGRIP